MASDVVNIDVCNLLKLCVYPTVNCHVICHYSYNHRYPLLKKHSSVVQHLRTNRIFVL